MGQGWRIIVVISVLVVSSPLHAERRGGTGRKNNYVTIDAGAYATNLKERFDAPSSMQSQVSSISGFLRLRRGFHLGRRFYFEPGLGTLLPWRNGNDGATKTFTTHLDFSLAVPIFSSLSLRAGPGVQWIAVVSSEQAVTLNNGTSTATFYTPGGTAHAILFTAQAALEIAFSRRLSLSLGAYVPDIGSRERRRYNGAVTLGLTL